MRKLNTIIFIIAFTLLSSAFIPSDSNTTNAGKWVYLGERKVDYISDRDVIQVTAAKGAYRALRFNVKRSPIRLNHITIHFGNGNTQKLNVNVRIPANQWSPILDLKGNKRIINKVVFNYKTPPRASKKALVKLFGRK